MARVSAGCCALLLRMAVPAGAILHSSARQAATMHSGLRAQSVRFLSFIGTEGSGHHLLTPVLRKVMNITLVEEQDIGPARHISSANFLGGEDLFSAFMANDNDAFVSALGQHQAGDLIQQAYSFPTKFQRRSTDSREYDLGSLYQMLSSAGVEQKAVVRYERDLGDCARSVFNRWPSLCSDSLRVCEEQQHAFDSHIEKQLEALSKMKVPVLRIGMDLLQQSCHKFGKKLLQFFREANLFLPNSPWSMEDQERTDNLTDTVCTVLEHRTELYLNSSAAESGSA